MGERANMTDPLIQPPQPREVNRYQWHLNRFNLYKKELRPKQRPACCRLRCTCNAQQRIPSLALPQRRIKCCTWCISLCALRDVTLFLASVIGLGTFLLFFLIISVAVQNLHFASLFGFLVVTLALCCWLLLVVMTRFFLQFQVTSKQLALALLFTILTYLLDWLHFAPFFKNAKPKSLSYLANLINRGQSVLLLLIVCYVSIDFMRKRLRRIKAQVGSLEQEQEKEKLPQQIAYNFFSHRHLMERCVMCEQHFQQGDLVLVLPCNIQHFFHKKCVDPWIFKDHTCPFCRAKVPLSYEI